MDWEANLAAIIKCTDANLEQQFRQFEDVTADFTAVEASASRDPSDNVANKYLRETMAAEYRHQQEQNRAQIPSYSRVSEPFARAPANSTFSDQFHRRQERKRGAVAAGRAMDNQRTHRRREYEGPKDADQVPEYDGDAARYANVAGGSGVYQQMYASPTYDIAQMMEQVRLSLKLEVDARAAIAERQLSALLQLCKATSEELDRIRVEVCANDRQLHTLDQVQSKIRQELTTQKDIGFHLQSMCGKDESWRMQTENQLLELRQMVATLREQGNSVQCLVQEKLSRSELLVQFNAAMEPIKAQIQANLQHQAQQIADITRTTSSSSLLLDGITQKVNRGITDEINELRNDLNALKHHVAKMDIFQDGGRAIHYVAPPSKEELEAKAKEKQRQKERDICDLREGLLKEVMAQAKDYVDSQTKPIRKMADENANRFADKRELETLQSALEGSCRNRCAATVAQADSQIKYVEDKLRGECSAVVKDISDRIERSIQQTASALTTTLEGQSSLWQNKQQDFLTMFEKEQKERKQALDKLNEALRKSRHRLEDQIHVLTQETRTKLSQNGSDFETRVKQVERQIETAIVELQRETQTTVTTLKGAMLAQGESNGVEWDQKLKRLEDTISSTNLAVATLSKSVKSLPVVDSSKPNNDNVAKETSLALEKQTSVYVSTVETMLQKMQLQLQLQAQSQAQMAMSPSPYHGYWPSSQFTGNQAPPPTLHLPPSLNPSAVASTVEQSSVTPAMMTPAETTIPSSPAPSLSHTGMISPSAVLNEQPEHSDKSVDHLRNALPVCKTAQISSPIPPKPVLPLSNPLPAEAESIPEIKALSSPSALQCASNLSQPDETDQANKLEHTLNTTAKGALAEAELAKARVESRRKQDLEIKLQQQRPNSASGVNMKETTTSNADLTSGNPHFTVPVVVMKAASSSLLGASRLTRSASSSALPRKDVPVRSTTPTLEDKILAPSNTPSIAAIGGVTTNTPLLQRVVKIEGAVVEPAIASQSEVKSASQQPPPVPTAVSPAVKKHEADSTRPSTANSESIERVPTPHQANIPTPELQKEATTSTLPISISSVSTSQDECPPALSPLAKIFARSSGTKAVETTQVSDDSTIPPKILSTTNTSKPAIPLDAVPAQDHMPLNVARSMSGANADRPSVSHVLCGLCRLPVRSDQKAEHENAQCPKRLVECVACKLEMQWVNLEMHELQCSTEQRKMTEVVNTSGNTKPLSDGDSNTQSEGSLKKCRHCLADVASLDLLEHEMNCDKVLKQCPHCLRRQKMSELQDHIENCDCRLVSCPNDCGGKFLQRGIPNHLATRCPKKPATASVPVAPAPPRTAHPETNKSASVLSPATSALTGKVECKFCDDEIESNKIDDHEENCDWKPKRCQHCNMVVISRDLLRHETSCKTNMKSCSHCNENMPQSALTTHATRCSKRPIKCIRCCQLFPADSIVAHSTNCKYVPGTSTPTNSSPLPQNAVGFQQSTSRAPIKIPPPPPFPPPPASTTTPQPASQLNTRRATADPRTNIPPSTEPTNTAAPETQSDRLARRNLALSQLTNPGPPLSAGNSPMPDRNNALRASAPCFQTRPGMQPGGHNNGDEDEEDEEEYDEDEDDDQLTLAQVVKEWSVENVCLWLHEDVGVPDVVIRFQQKQCNGEMLLELTESDLVNDFGVKDRIQRERILNAIEAIKTSDVFSDEDENDDEEDDENDLEESEDASHTRHSIAGANYVHPRDILQRTSQPSPQRVLGSELPSSNDMLRRISSALENPKR